MASEANVKLKRMGEPPVLPIKIFMGIAVAYSKSETSRIPLTVTPVTTMALAEAANRARKEKTQANRFIVIMFLLQLILLQNRPDPIGELFSKNMQGEGFLP